MLYSILEILVLYDDRSADDPTFMNATVDGHFAGYPLQPQYNSNGIIPNGTIGQFICPTYALDHVLKFKVLIHVCR